MTIPKKNLFEHLSVLYVDDLSLLLLSCKDVESYWKYHLNNYREQWKFITPRAAWHRGMWDRFIELTKTSLRKLEGTTLKTVDELQTIVMQIEAEINDRPLTHVSSDPSDSDPIRI